MRNFFVGLWRNRRAQDLVEYCLLAAFVALAAVALIGGSNGTTISQLFSQIASVMTAANGT